MRKGLLLAITLVIISVIPVFDLFFTHAQPTTFDGIIHISTIAQFSRALQSGDFPVIWLNSFANYGLPVGLFAQQLPMYVGAVINILVNNPLLSFNSVLFLGIFFTNVFFYRFLRFYVGQIAAIIGVLLLTLAPLHIIDIYIRGDLPEVFADLFLPLILIGGYLFIKRKEIRGFFLLLISVAGMTLSHPMMLLVNSFFFIPYFIFLLLSNVDFSLHKLLTKQYLWLVIGLISSIGIGVGLGSYYIIPLLLEIKYFYFGNEISHLSSDQYLSFANFFNPHWYYFYNNDIATRGQFIITGFIEILSLPIALLYFIKKRGMAKNEKVAFVACTFIVGCVLLFFTISLSSPFYTHIHILDDLQFPWRFLAAFLFIPPIIFAIVLDEVNNTLLFLGFILLICVARFPQLYGKNYIAQAESTYYASLINLQSVRMNTIWTGKTESYPARKGQASIIQGEGKITTDYVKNSSRQYIVTAITPIRIEDYTFFFPGWKVFVDKIPTTIEFQDPQYRGVITYTVPQGQHTVDIIFTDTGIRKVAKVLSIIFVGILLCFFLLRKRLQKLLIR